MKEMERSLLLLYMSHISYTGAPIRNTGEVVLLRVWPHRNKLLKLNSLKVLKANEICKRQLQFI
jgi:hypothetical protein